MNRILPLALVATLLAATVWLAFFAEPHPATDAFLECAEERVAEGMDETYAAVACAHLFDDWED